MMKIEAPDQACLIYACKGYKPYIRWVLLCLMILSFGLVIAVNYIKTYSRINVSISLYLSIHSMCIGSLVIYIKYIKLEVFKNIRHDITKELNSSNPYMIKVKNIKQILQNHGICGAWFESIIIVQHYCNEGQLTTNVITS